jgi:hypothetical protein
MVNSVSSVGNSMTMMRSGAIKGPPLSPKLKRLFSWETLMEMVYFLPVSLQPLLKVLKLAQVSQFRATEMSRVHKNPILAAIKHGN